jgi:hypothetical protein
MHANTKPKPLMGFGTVVRELSFCPVALEKL